MHVTAYKTPLVTPNSHKITELLDVALPALNDGCVVVVAAKVVSLCEGRVIPIESMAKDEVVAREAMYYIPSHLNPYNVTLSIARNQLVASAGVDESNGGGYYVLWPADLQASANMIREHLASKYDIKEVGVIISDSTTRPFQWGTTGIGLASSGFKSLHSYIGEPDLFGRSLEFQKNNIQNGLAAAAVVVGGEGNERTPFVVIEDISFVEFTGRNPTPEELNESTIEPDGDVFTPLMKSIDWVKGEGK
jgi:dihydrofolate synthase / folylpolyglutamate synthase